jgi:hypothetical protein
MVRYIFIPKPWWTMSKRNPYILSASPICF